MSTHESIRNMLPLSAAGALNQQEQLQVEAHARNCEICRTELDAWSVYAAGLRGLPQPAAPADLIARTQARILRERETAASHALEWFDAVRARDFLVGRQRCLLGAGSRIVGRKTGSARNESGECRSLVFSFVYRGFDYCGSHGAVDWKSR